MTRLLAIGFVWLGCAAAWAVLGGTLVARSGEVSGDLLQEVHALWGPPRTQLPPSATASETHKVRERTETWDPARKVNVVGAVEKDVSTVVPAPLEASDIAARIDLEHRRKGLLWFPTYAVAFEARYTFRNATPEARRVEVTFPLETGKVIYDGFEVTGPGGRAVEPRLDADGAAGGARFAETFAPGEARQYTVRYRTRGTASWAYGSAQGGLGAEGGRARNFHLALETSFPDVDFAPGALSPSRHGPAGGGWRGTWEFGSLVGSSPIEIVLPQKLNPGPLAARITFFAPLGLLFFFFVVAVLAAARRRDLHPMHYFLVGCAFFAFHLLFAYLIDHVEIPPAFALASVVSALLVVSYARLFVGWRFALGVIAPAQLVYLVLFSFTFFWQGFTGLAITVGAILTLALIMQITGRVDWSERTARRAPPPPPPAPAAAPGGC